MFWIPAIYAQQTNVIALEHIQSEMPLADSAWFSPSFYFKGKLVASPKPVTKAYYIQGNYDSMVCTFKVFHNQAIAQQIFIHTSYAYLAQIATFNSKGKLGETTIGIKASKQDPLLNNMFSVPVVVTPNDTTTIVLTITQPPIWRQMDEPKIWLEKSYWAATALQTKLDAAQNNYHSLILGAFLFGICFFALMGLKYRSWGLSFYTLYLVAEFFFLLSKTDITHAVGISNYNGYLTLLMLSETVQFMGYALYGLFVVYFLDIEPKKLLYKLAMLFIAALAMYAIGIGIYKFWYQTLNTPHMVFNVSRTITHISLFVLLVAILFMVKSKLKYFIIAGSVVFFVFVFYGNTIQMQGDYISHPVFYSPMFYVKTGLVLECIVFALAIGYKVQLISNENNTNREALINQLQISKQLAEKDNELLNEKVLEISKTLVAQESEQLKSTYNAQLQALEVKALRSQMNPHFIFNTLNNIRYQLQKFEYEHAEKYLVKFSKLLRKILENSQLDVVRLEEELSMTKLYIDIEQQRIGNSLECIIKIDNSVHIEELLVPPLFLQPIVENAIKHGLSGLSLENKRIGINVVSLAGDGFGIIVTDNGRGFLPTVEFDGLENVDSHKSLGTTITQDRLRLYSQQSSYIATMSINSELTKGTTVTIKFIPKK